MESKVNNKCALCGRELAEPFDRHHIIPRSRGGREKVELHRICHSKIHSVFTIKELKSEFSSIDELKQNKGIMKFVKWLEGKPPQFYKNTKWNIRSSLIDVDWIPLSGYFFRLDKYFLYMILYKSENGCARSSAGQSNGLLIRRSEVRILSGAKFHLYTS